jgi:hypothetical protein
MIRNHTYFSFLQQLPQECEQLPLCYFEKYGGLELGMV